MRTESINKTLVGCLGLVLMFSSVFVFQPASASKSGTMIWGIVTVEGTAGEPVGNATIVLYDLHTNQSTSVATNADGIYEIEPPSAGHYGLLATKKGYYDNNANNSIYIASTTQGLPPLNITMRKVTTPFKLNGTITNASDSLPIASATVTLILKSDFYQIYGLGSGSGGYFTTTTNQSGYYEFPDVFDGAFTLEVSATGFFTSVSTVNITGDQQLNISLTKTAFPYVVRGYVYYNGERVTNNFVFLYDKQKEKIVANNSTGSSFSFSVGAYAGEFLLMLQSGYKQYFKDVTVTNANVSLNIGVEAYEFEERATKIDFVDWQNVYVNESRKLTSNSVIEKLTNIGNPRLQIDIGYGDGNGDLSASEVKAFTDALNATGSKYNESKRLFTVNGVSYGLTDYFVTLENAVGADSSGELMYLNTTMKFNTSAVNTSQAGYNITKSIIGQIKFPALYESSILNATAITDPYVIPVTVNTPPVAVNFSVPSVVPSNTNVTFDDQGSFDAITSYSSLNFTWNFGDSVNSNATNPNTAYGSDEAIHVYTVPGFYNVTLTVTDAVGNSSSWGRWILVDGTLPTSVFSFNAIGEHQVVAFNATDSQDNGIYDGGIKSYNWFFDDNTSEQNYYNTTNNTETAVNHAFAYPGVYNVTLTVVDNATNKNTAMQRVNVADKTPPVGKIVVSNKTGEVINIMEGENLTFTAEAFDEYYGDGILSNATSNENASIQRISYYNWSFGDDKYDYGTNRTVTHTYDKGAIDEYQPTISVTVTDASGNSAVINLTAPLVEVSPKNISKITILDGSLKLSDDAPTEGQLIKINATVSNVGRRYAENVVVDFYVGSTKIDSQTISNLSAKDTANNTIVATIDWVVNVKPGRYTVRAVVADPNNASRYVVYGGDQNRTLNVRQQEIPRDLYIYSGIIIFLVIVIGVYVLNRKKRDKLVEEDKGKKKIDQKKQLPMKPIKKK